MQISADSAMAGKSNKGSCCLSSKVGSSDASIRVLLRSRTVVSSLDRAAWPRAVVKIPPSSESGDRNLRLTKRVLT